MYGKVNKLWRYPVKSMLGEQLQAVTLDSRGVVGDRTYAVKDLNGKFGSGKNTRRFRKIDGLFNFRAWYDGDELKVRFPCGYTTGLEDPEIDSFLSREFGQPLQLVEESEVPHMDAGPIHLVTAGALNELKDVAPEGAADSRRFRPNIVLSTESGQLEKNWLGARLKIGDVELKVFSPTERCGMVSFAQDDLVAAPQILKHITQQWGQDFGVYAEVVKPGAIVVGQEIEVLAE